MALFQPVTKSFYNVTDILSRAVFVSAWVGHG